MRRRETKVTAGDGVIDARWYSALRGGHAEKKPSAGARGLCRKCLFSTSETPLAAFAIFSRQRQRSARRKRRVWLSEINARRIVADEPPIRRAWRALAENRQHPRKVTDGNVAVVAFDASA